MIRMNRLTCDAVYLVITRIRITLIPSSTPLFWVYRELGNFDYWRRICDNTVSPTPNAIMYRCSWRGLCVESLVAASVAVRVPLCVDILVDGGIYNLVLSLSLLTLRSLDFGSIGNSSSLDVVLLGGALFGR